MALAKTKKEQFTYKDYKKWPSDERWEIIYGDAYNMSLAPSIAHQEAALAIALELSNRLKDSSCKIIMAPVDVLLQNDLAEKQEDDIDTDTLDTVVQPDILVVCDKSKIGKQNIKGAPDLIVEVLSPATAKKDEGIKRDLYQHNGVKEYWLVHPLDKTVNRYVLNNNIYEKPAVYGENDTIEVSISPDLIIDLNQVFIGS